MNTFKVPSAEELKLAIKKDSKDNITGNRRKSFELISPRSRDVSSSPRPPSSTKFDPTQFDNLHRGAHQLTYHIHWELAMKTLDMHDFKGNEHILDIGCGDGLISSQMALKLVPNGRVLGIDSDHSLIEKNLQTFANYPEQASGKTKNFSFEACNATELAQTLFRNGGLFDVVVSFSTLHWVQDHDAVLDGIGSMMRAGGYLLMNFAWEMPSWYEPTWRELAAEPKFEKFFKDYVLPSYVSKEWKEQAHWRGYTGIEAGYSELLRSHGFLPEVVQLERQSVSFESRAQFESFIRAREPTHRHISDNALSQEFFQALISRAEHSCRQEDGTYKVVDSAFLFIKARYHSEFHETALVITPRSNKASPKVSPKSSPTETRKFNL